MSDADERGSATGAHEDDAIEEAEVRSNVSLSSLEHLASRFNRFSDGMLSFASRLQLLALLRPLLHPALLRRLHFLLLVLYRDFFQLIFLIMVSVPLPLLHHFDLTVIMFVESVRRFIN